MCWMQTTCQSITGKYLYSDQAWATYDSKLDQVPTLNYAANLVGVGVLAGITRCALAMLHILGHLFATLAMRDTGHLKHALKGSVEFLRGLIEALPIVGRIFSWSYNPQIFYREFDLMYLLNADKFSCERQANFFLLRIFNPNQPDEMDRIAQFGGAHPYLSSSIEENNQASLKVRLALEEEAEAKPFSKEERELLAELPLNTPTVLSHDRVRQLQVKNNRNHSDYYKFANFHFDFKAVSEGSCLYQVTRTKIRPLKSESQEVKDKVATNRPIYRFEWTNEVFLQHYIYNPYSLRELLA